RQGTHPRARRGARRPLRAALPRHQRQSQVRRPLSSGESRRGGFGGEEDGAPERLDEPPSAQLPRSPAARPAPLYPRRQIELAPSGGRCNLLAPVLPPGQKAIRGRLGRPSSPLRVRLTRPAPRSTSPPAYHRGDSRAAPCLLPTCPL